MATAPSTRQRLDSWKEIAAFFGRDERTVNRWEKEKGLPVHRLPGTKGRVYAFEDELSRWLEESRPIRIELADRIDAEELLENGSESAIDENSVRGPQPVEIVRQSVADREVLPATPTAYRWFAKALFVALIAMVGLLALALPFRFRGNFTKPRLTDPASSSKTRDGSDPAATAHDPEAEQLYLKGRYYWNKRTPEDLDKALDFFTQAVVHDPNYAQAYMGMADCYNLMREYTMMPPSVAYPRALAAAKKAVELAPQSSEAHASLAFAVFFGLWDVKSGETEFRSALELDPKNATAHHWYSSALIISRRLPEALAEIKRAQALDPSSTSILADEGHILILAGQREEGVALLKQLEKTEPAFLSPHRYLRDLYLTTADYPDFLAESKKDAELVHDGSERAVTAAAEQGFAIGGGPGLLHGLLQAQKKLYQQGKIPPSSLAETSALLGEKKESLEYLQAAYDQHDDAVLAIESYSAFDRLRDQPAYRDLLARLNLPVGN